MPEIENLSLLFDSAWYLSIYTDVASANADPLEHYLLFGYKEGRNPNRFFNTHFYVQNNPDVADSTLNPFIHYILYGASEGRLPRPEGTDPHPRTVQNIVPSVPSTPIIELQEELVIETAPTEEETAPAKSAPKPPTKSKIRTKISTVGKKKKTA